MRVKELFIIWIALLSFNSAKSQTNFFQIVGENRIKFFYNASADVTIEKHADYSRIANFNPSNLVFHGPFTDYDKKGNCILSGSFVNGEIDGYCTYFYEDSVIKEVGNYNSGIRDSIWTYNYPNGQIEKVVDYKNGIPYIISSFNEKGKQLIINGTGKYTGRLAKNNGKSKKYPIKGELVDGKLDGKWSIKGVTNEYFENGVFIKGHDVLEYTHPQQISLSNILGYYCQEEFKIFQNKFFCQTCVENSSWSIANLPVNRISTNINYAPYETFIKKYSELLDSLGVNGITQILEFSVSTDGSIGQINSVNTDSIVNNTLTTNVLKSIKWFPLQSESHPKGFIFMTLVKLDNQVYLANPIVITDNLENNFLIKQMSENNLNIY